MYADLAPTARSKITNLSVLVPVDSLVILSFPAVSSRVKICVCLILVGLERNANLEMIGRVVIDPCVLVLLDSVEILSFLVPEVRKNHKIIAWKFIFFLSIGECENDSECRSDQACFNFSCKDSCQDACGVNAQCKALNHGLYFRFWFSYIFVHVLRPMFWVSSKVFLKFLFTTREFAFIANIPRVTVS